VGSCNVEKSPPKGLNRGGRKKLNGPGTGDRRRSKEERESGASGTAERGGVSLLVQRPRGNKGEMLEKQRTSRKKSKKGGGGGGCRKTKGLLHSPDGKVRAGARNRGDGGAKGTTPKRQGGKNRNVKLHKEINIRYGKGGGIFNDHEKSPV